MFQLIKDVLTQPSAAFRELPERGTPRQAIALVLVIALIGAFAGFRPGGRLDLFLASFVVAVAGSFATWALVAWVVATLAARVFRGAGAFQSTLTALAFAGMPLAFATLLGQVLQAFGIQPQLFQLFCVGWAVLLLYIATREIHALSGLRVAACILPGLVLAGGMSFAVGRFESYVACYDNTPPLGDIISWSEEPPDTEQIVQNGGFEAPAAPAAQPDGQGPVPLAAGWQKPAPGPLGFLCRPVGEIDDTGRKSGKVSAHLAVRGLPQFDAFSSAFQELPRIEPGAKVHFAVFIKTDRAVFATAVLVFLGADKSRPYTGVLQTEIIRGTRDWKEYRVKGVVPKDTQRAAISLVLRGAGDMWVDDVRLLVPKAAAPAPAPAEARTPASAVAAAVKSLPPDAFQEGPAAFVAAVRDRTAARLDTKDLRHQLETELAAQRRLRLAEASAEAAAHLNDIDFQGGKPLDPKAAQARAAAAGLQYFVVAEFAPGDKPGAMALRLWVIHAPTLSTVFAHQDIQPPTPPAEGAGPSTRPAATSR